MRTDDPRATVEGATGRGYTVTDPFAQGLVAAGASSCTIRWAVPMATTKSAQGVRVMFAGIVALNSIACARPAAHRGDGVARITTPGPIRRVEPIVASADGGSTLAADVHAAVADAAPPRVDEPVTAATRVAVARRIAELRNEAAQENASPDGDPDVPRSNPRFTVRVAAAGISVVRWEAPLEIESSPRPHRIRLVAEEGVADVSNAVGAGRDTLAPHASPTNSTLTLEGDPRTSVARLRSTGARSASHSNESGTKTRVRP